MGNKESVRRPTPEELLLIEYLAQNISCFRFLD